MGFTDYLLCAFALAVALSASASRAEDEIVFDFETGDLQGWHVVEGYFAAIVSDRANFHNRPEQPYNKQGRYFLSTLEMPDGSPNDAQMGTIVSPVFRLTSETITFLVGGGAHANTFVALCSEDGQELLHGRGRNDETMQRVTWDAAAYIGRNVFVKIVDHNQGSWGHVTFDDFRAHGAIDVGATERVGAYFSDLEKARLEKVAADRAARLAELTDERVLFSRGERTIYRGERLTAISLPVGGIGTGSIHMDGQGVRHAWHIFNNIAQAHVPDSFFAVRAKIEGQGPVLRRLETAEARHFTPMAGLSFRGEYPFGWFEFEDPQMPIQVVLEVFNPLIPLDTKRSAIPCAIYNLTAANPGRRPVQVTFLATQMNLVGYTGEGQIDHRRHPAFGGNRNRIISAGKATYLHMTGDLPDDAPCAGDMVLATFSPNAQGVAWWSDVEALAKEFARLGAVEGPQEAGPSPGGETLNGALTVSLTLPPGEKATVPFMLTWYFPNVRHGHSAWGGYGNRYASWWDDALEVARYVRRELTELTRLTRLYHETLYETNLPIWLLDRISSQVAVLKSNTVFWSKSGYFGGWEGCSESSGCCPGNCSHVWHYAQAHARLFPELARRMREQEFRYQSANGLIPFRQGLISTPAGDAQAGAVLNTYREYLTSANGEWLHKWWPSVKRAMDFHIATWDPDEDGMLAGRQHNTLDADSTGTSSWLGSMYLAALAAAERMAIIENDTASAERYRRVRQAGELNQNNSLWNGSYYIQSPEEPMIRDYGSGCHIDQVLGQWWAHQLDLGWIYPPDRVRTALRSLFENNFRANFRGIVQSPRKFVADEDPGMQMITWPLGGRPDPNHCMFYADEVMSGFEYSAAAAMIQAGLLHEGFAIIHAAWLRYDGRLRTDLAGAAWGYSGNPFGDDECGKYYARPMSIWSALLACQGYICNGPARLVGFRPVWRPENHKSLFVAAEGWGLFTQKRTARKQTERIEVRAGRLRVKNLVFEVPEGRGIKQVAVMANQRPTEATYELSDGRLTITLASEVTISEGQSVEAELRW